MSALGQQRSYRRIADSSHSVDLDLPGLGGIPPIANWSAGGTIFQTGCRARRQGAPAWT